MSADKPRLPRRVSRATPPASGDANAPAVTPLTAPDPATTEWVPLWNPSAGLASAVGDIGHDAVDSGAPVKIGAFASGSISAQTPVAQADRTNLMAGLDGLQLVRLYCNLEDIVEGNGSSVGTADVSLIAALGSGLRIYITSVILTNTSATDSYAYLKSGAAAIKQVVPVPKNGGAVLTFPIPIKCAMNEAFIFMPQVAVTTMWATCIGFKSKL